MKKLAFFVEGETEAEFVEKLIKEFVTPNRVLMNKPSRINGKNRDIMITDIESKAEFYVNIIISGADNHVNDDIRNNIASLSNADYNLIIALKDLRGKDHWHNMKLEDLPKVKRSESRLYKQFNDYLDTFSIIAVMEIETWFIGDTNHYGKISPEITKQKVLDNLDKILDNVNPYECKLEEIEKPAETLDSIYKLGGKAYDTDKPLKTRQRTINALDFSNVCFSLPKRLESLKELMVILDKFFA